MQIFIKTLTRTLALDVTHEMFLREVKQKISEKEAIPSESIRLVFSNKELVDSRKLSESQVQNGSTLFMALKVKGGTEISKKNQSNS